MSSYGTPSDVASLARVWTNNGEWINANETYGIRGTNPTYDTVQDWLDQVSNQMNIALGAQWFVVPIDPDISPITYSAVTGYVVALVAAKCHEANNVDKETTPEGKIMKDMAAWVETNADGFALDAVKQTPAPSIKRQIQFRMIG